MVAVTMPAARRATPVLTPAELRVLREVADGKTTKRIAALSYHSRATIKGQRHSILVKLGAENMPHAVAIGFRRGLLS